jgi:hypothetical protein
MSRSRVIELNKDEEQLLLEMVSAIKSIKYGYIQITIHDGNVVQIDKTEKIRLDGQKHR